MLSMTSSTTTYMNTIIKASSTAVAIVVVGISIWIPYAKHRWETKLQCFIENHKNDGMKQHATNNNNNNRKKQAQQQQQQNDKNNEFNNGSNTDNDILLIVNPASGGGKSMKFYSTILEELRRYANNANGGEVHVLITQSSKDMINNFTRHASPTKDYHHISKYKAIAIMGGDSSITEFVQHTLREHNGIWPYSPILHLPTGTGNAISTECFGSNTSIQNIIKHGLTKFRWASILKITTTTSSSSAGEKQEQPKYCYALHNCFDGVQRHMIDTLDKFRPNLYPAFGSSIVIPLVMASLFTYNNGKNNNNNKIPYVLAILTDTEGMGMKLNFGLSRFSSNTITNENNNNNNNKMMMMIIRAIRWPGPIAFLKLFQKFMSGELGIDFCEGKQLPDWLYMEKTSKYTLTAGDDDDDNSNNNVNNFNMYLDGGGTIPCKGSLPVTIEVIPNAIPYFVYDDDDDE